MLIKYRLGELAKDFDLQNKEVIALLADKFPGEKKHTTVLTESELNYIFDELTKKYSAKNFDAYLKPEGKPEEKPEENAEPTAEKPAEQPKTAAVEKEPKEKAPEKKKTSQPQPKKDRITKVVDTGSASVDLDKYSEKYENLAESQARSSGQMSSRKAQSQGSKQKLNQKSKQKKYKTFGKQKRETEAEKLQRIQLEKARKAQLKISIPDEISVGELATRLKATSASVVKKLMELGVMASVSDTIDFDTAALVAEEMNAKVEHEVHVSIEERLIDDTEDDEKDLVPRAPVVVVMGHVDHGKTSLLDYIRKTKVTSTEAGGITQHIGAYRVKVNDRMITFLDTPGHEAFTAMRARGAMLTDIAILVIAADDGIMPQTVEAINHAKAANVTIIVAINKIDKPNANPERVKKQLTEYGLVSEEWGGDTVCCNVSALTGEGVDNLLEMLLLVADMKELKANPNRLAKGAVIEARLDKGRGPIASVLIQNGTLHLGDVIIAGTAVGRVRTMIDDRGKRIKSAGPSEPVEIAGLIDVPNGGDVFNAVEDEKLARELANQRKSAEQAKQWNSYTKVTLDNLFSQIEEGDRKELPIVVKADVQGTAEALKDSLEKLSNDEVKVSVIHAAVGGITANDVMLAKASGAVIIGFNVRPDSNATEQAKADGVEMRMYRVIYDAIDDVEAALKGMLAPKTREVEEGSVEVREVYKISSVGTVAGCYVTSGSISRGSLVRVVRDGIIIHDDKVASLRRFKDDVKEVSQGYECGVTLEKFADIKQGDIFETYLVEEYRE
ncbi:MAG: translation initiation factor IF-2 [Oscillospiraceae bacterium]|jgi:translation initiation factor IF-2